MTIRFGNITAASTYVTPASAAIQRSQLGIPSVYESSAVNITGGSIKGVSLIGTTGTGSATTGTIGEYVASVASSQNFPATGTFGDITSIGLTAGDWDVTGHSEAAINTATGFTNWLVAMSSASGNSNAGLAYGVNICDAFAPLSTSPQVIGASIPSWRVSIGTSATYYLKIQGNYTGGAPGVFGRISARRMR